MRNIISFISGCIFCIVNLLISQPGLAYYSVCEADQLSSCSSNMDDFQCLELMQACGRYDEIISHFESEFEQNLNSFYFKGVSYYQLAQIEMSKANECDYYDKAFDNLVAYENLYFDMGEQSFEHTSDYVHHVTKLVQELQNSGCINTEISLPIIRKKTREYTRSLLDSLFLDNQAKAGMAKIIQAIKTRLNALNEAIITTASDIETQVELRSIAIKENLVTITSINTAVAEVKEKLGDEALDVIIDHSSGLEEFQQQISQVEQIMGQQSPEHYAAKRDEVINITIAAVDRAADTSAMVSQQFKTQSPSFQSVQQALIDSENQPVAKPVQVFEDIKQRYRQARQNQCTTGSSLWFCN